MRGRPKPMADFLLVRANNLAVVDHLLHLGGVLPVHGAANRVAGSENLLDGAGKVPGARPRPHLPSDLVDVVEREVSVVLDVLLLLPIPKRLLEGPDDEGARRWNNRHSGLTVLHGELHGHLESEPVLLGGGGDLISDLLWGQTERTNLWGKRGGSADLSTPVRIK